MDFAQTVLLGALAGLTIYLGLPVGRIRRLSPQVRTFFSMASAGTLFFLLFDILRQLTEPIEGALQQVTAGQTPVEDFLLLLGTFIIGFGISLLGLITFEQRLMRAGNPQNGDLSPILYRAKTQLSRENVVYNGHFMRDEVLSCSG